MSAAPLPEDVEEMVALCFNHLAAGRATEALDAADIVAAHNDGIALIHEVRGLALTRAGRIEDADRAFARAVELEPEEYLNPFRLTRDEFDAAVEQTLSELPEKFRDYLENVEVGVDDVPSPELLAEGLEFDLLGVYIGATAAESDDWAFPDRVVLFQRNLENISPDRETLLAEIRDTLLHEVGHHFGMDEETLRAIEEDG